MYDVGAKLALLVMTILFLSSCGSAKLQTEGQEILKKLTYQVNTDDSRVNTTKIKNELSDLVTQIPQKKSWLNPRTWGKTLTVYDDDATEESIEKFTQYLRNRKGFYEAVVKSVIENDDRNVDLTYIVDLGPRHYISSIKLDSPDSSLLLLLKQYEESSELAIGEPLDSRSFDREQVRLVNIAKDNGYADFSPTFLEFRGDSTAQNVDVTIYIYPPYPAPEHIQYSVGDIHVYTEHLPSKDPQYSARDSMNSQDYYSKSDKFVVNPFVLSKVMPLQEGQLFSRDTEIRTNRNLTKLSPYRFISVDPYINPANDSILNYNIFLTPHEKKWIFDTGGNLFFSVLNGSAIANQDLIGFSGNAGFENRNFANKAVRHRFGIEGSLEFEVPSFRANTVSLQLNNSFELPGIVDIFNTSKLLNKIGLLTDRSYNDLNYDGTTQINFNLGLTSILNFYDLNFAEAAVSYSFQPSTLARYTFKQIGVNVLDTDIKEGFQDILAGNPLLDKSFQSYLLTGFLFRELVMYRRTKESDARNHFAFLGTFESSGFENFLVNGAFKKLNISDGDWKIGGLEFSQFVRFEADLRFNQKIKNRASLATRLNFGVILPYGQGQNNTGVVAPFIKQFFVGGPNSIRGWQIRELGPGAYIHTPNTINEPFFQAADLKIEFNTEYRFDLFYVFEGALFIDAGNIWTLREDAERANSKFSSSFLNEFAISAGWGLRLDFDYFLFRFDFGYKLRTPYEDPETQKRWFNQTNKILGNINFAINYPF